MQKKRRQSYLRHLLRNCFKTNKIELLFTVDSRDTGLLSETTINPNYTVSVYYIHYTVVYTGCIDMFVYIHIYYIYIIYRGQKSGGG